MSTLTNRQMLVLECVKDAQREGKKPTAKSITTRMVKKGHHISDRQAAYDLNVIIYAKDSGVIAARYGNSPTVYLYTPPKPVEPPKLFTRTAFCAGVYMIGTFKGEIYQVDIPWRISKKQPDGKFMLLTESELEQNPQLIEVLQSEFERATETAKRDLAFGQKQKYGKSYARGF